MKNKRKAFTLSEVIITLVVIGIVAAITVPMMSSNAHDKKWNVARQKAQATIGEAFRLMTVNGEISTTNPDGTPRTTEYMVTKVLPKYLKLEKTCGSGAVAAGACGFKMVSGTPKVKTPAGNQVNLPLTWSASTTAYGVTGSRNAQNLYTSRSTNNPTTQNYNNSYFFRTLDGFSVNFFYNPYCGVDEGEKYYVGGSLILDLTCFNAVYDMNGKKGPNQVGKDIGFIGAFFNSFNTKSSTMLPHSSVKTLNSGLANNFSVAKNYCNNLEKSKEWTLPDLYEAMLMYINNTLIGNNISLNSLFVSKTLFVSDYEYLRIVHYGTNEYAGTISQRLLNNVSNNSFARCVRANALK